MPQDEDIITGLDGRKWHHMGPDHWHCHEDGTVIINPNIDLSFDGRTRAELGNCFQCNGTGKFERPPGQCGPAEIVTCWRCEGTGRAVVAVQEKSE